MNNEINITASGLWLIEQCPGSAQAKEDFGAEPRKATEQMERGTLLHSACYDAVNLPESELANRYELDVVNIAKNAVATVKQMATEFLGDRWKAEWETRFSPPSRDFPKLVSGRPDAVIYSEDQSRWMIIDFKYASSDRPMTVATGQTPDDSWQMWAGLLAAVAVRTDFAFQKVEQAYLAYVYLRDDGTIDVRCSRKMTADDISVRVAGIHALYKAASHPNAIRVPGPHCSYCEAKNVCYARIPLTVIGIAQSPNSGQSMMRMNPAIAAGLLRLKPLIEAALDGAKNILLQLNDKELNKLGLRKADPIVRQTVSDVVSAFQTLRDHGYPEAAILRNATLSLTKLYRTIAAIDGIAVGEAEDKLKKLLADYIGESESEPRLLPVKGYKDTGDLFSATYDL